MIIFAPLHFRVKHALELRLLFPLDLFFLFVVGCAQLPLFILIKIFLLRACGHGRRWSDGNGFCGVLGVLFCFAADGFHEQNALVFILFCLLFDK